MSNLQSHFKEGMEHQHKLLDKLRDDHKKKLNQMNKTYSFMKVNHSIIEDTKVNNNNNSNNNDSSSKNVMFGIELSSSEDLNSSSDGDYASAVDNQYLNGFAKLPLMKKVSVESSGNESLSVKKQHHSTKSLPFFNEADIKKINSNISLKSSVSPRMALGASVGGRVFPFNDDDTGYSTDGGTTVSNTSPKKKNGFYRYGMDIIYFIQ